MTAKIFQLLSANLPTKLVCKFAVFSGIDLKSMQFWLKRNIFFVSLRSFGPAIFLGFMFWFPLPNENG